jgi:ferredoxin-NADP reductase
MKARLTQKQEIAEGTLYLEFTTDKEELRFAPGQFFRLALVNPAYNDERGSGRFLGFVNTPGQNKIAATVTRVGPSAFKRSLVQANIGAEAEIDGIDGKMTLPEDTAKPVVFVTGGIGIAPIMSLLRWVKEKSLEHKITLVYSNTNRARAIFMDELATYTSQNKNFRMVATMTQDEQWPGVKRRIDGQFLIDYLELSTDNQYVVTGTPRFVPAMVKALRGIGVTPAQTKFEIFTGY